MRPSSSTVQAPHWPWSQPFLVPMRSSRSRRASSRVVRLSTVRECVSPLTRSEIAVDLVEVIHSPGAERRLLGTFRRSFPSCRRVCLSSP